MKHRSDLPKRDRITEFLTTYGQSLISCSRQIENLKKNFYRKVNKYILHIKVHKYNWFIQLCHFSRSIWRIINGPEETMNHLIAKFIEILTFPLRWALTGGLITWYICLFSIYLAVLIVFSKLKIQAAYEYAVLLGISPDSSTFEVLVYILSSQWDHKVEIIKNLFFELLSAE